MSFHLCYFLGSFSDDYQLKSSFAVFKNVQNSISFFPRDKQRDRNSTLNTVAAVEYFYLVLYLFPSAIFVSKTIDNHVIQTNVPPDQWTKLRDHSLK